MKHLKMVGLTAVAAAALLAFAGTASATKLTNGSGSIYGVSTVIHANAEGTTTLHPPIGDITCTSSTVEGLVEAWGTGAEQPVSGSLQKFTFGGCNATVTVLKPGSFNIHTKIWLFTDGNGTFTSTGAEVTVVFAGFHCIFTTNNTDIGTITGSKTGNATLDIEATIPRTGGSAFCGSTAQWTGSYKIDKPSPLYID